MNVEVVFGIILAVIVIISILAFGSRQIAEFLGLSNAAITKKSVEDLRATAARAYSLGEGSTLEFRLSIPANARFCFVDPENPEANIDPDPDRRWTPDSIVMGIITENMYTLWAESPGEQDGYAIDYVRPLENFCAKTGTRLYFENRGLYVSVTD